MVTMITKLGLREVHDETPSIDELAEHHFAILERGIKKGVLHMHFDNGNVMFYSHAFYDFLNKVGDSPESRTAFKSVGEQPASRDSNPKNREYTRMRAAVNNYAQSRTIVSSTVGGITRRMNDVVFGYLLSGSPVNLYAAKGQGLYSETLSNTPYVTINLKVR